MKPTVAFDTLNLSASGFQKLIVPEDLDLLAHKRQDARSIIGSRRSPKLFLNLIFRCLLESRAQRCSLPCASRP